MPRSERAAGLVPFVVMLVLFLAALGWGYGNFSDLDQAQKDRKAAQDALKLEAEAREKVEFEFTQLQNRVGTGNAQQLNTEIERYVTEMREALSVPFLGNQLDIPESAGEITRGPEGNVVVKYVESGKTAASLNALETFAPILAAAKGIVTDLKAYDARNIALLAQIEKMTKDQQAAIQAKDTEFDQTVANLNSEVARRDSRIDDLTREKTQADNDARQARDQAETARAAAKAATDDARNKVLVLDEEVKREKAGIALVRNDEPDGEVLASSMSTGMVVINRGRKHNLKPGTVFQVYTHGKGGVRIMKGLIRVLSSGETTAKCGLVEGRDIVAGDLIFNRLYSADQPLRFALLGRMTKYGASQAKTILENLGNKVDEKVSMHTDYLLVGTSDDGETDITQTDEYKEAMRFGVQIITERELELFTLY